MISWYKVIIYNFYGYFVISWYSFLILSIQVVGAEHTWNGKEKSVFFNQRQNICCKYFRKLVLPLLPSKKENIFVYMIENICWYGWKYFFMWLKLFVASQRKIAESQRTNLISRSNPVTCFVGKDKDTLHDIHKDRSSSFIWNRENICWRNGATIKWQKNFTSAA